MNWRIEYNRIKEYLFPFGSRRRKFAKLFFKLKRTYRRRGLVAPQEVQCLADFKLNRRQGVVIFSAIHCRHIAKLFEEALIKLEIPVEIIYTQPKNGYKNVPHIIISPLMPIALPKLYVSFQLEQSVSSRWFDEWYLQRLSRGAAIFDYSCVNLDFLRLHNVPPNNLYYLPISWSRSIVAEDVNKEYDVVFYGEMECARRIAIVEKLKKRYRVTIIYRLYGDELYKELKKAKIIINIHYYEGALLETTRIYECLSLNSSVVISEKSSDMTEQEELLDMVDFVEVGDVQGLQSRIDYYLHNEEARENRLAHNKEKMTNCACTRFEYYFYKFLLATDNVSRKKFSELTSGATKC